MALGGHDAFERKNERVRWQERESDREMVSERESNPPNRYLGCFTEREREREGERERETVELLYRERERGPGGAEGPQRP